MHTTMETYFGYVKTPQDAIILFEACQRGIFSRVQRRLSEKERAAIRSGSVFVWDEREAGMRRWTDGRTWSPSRVSGSFLTYRELDSKRRGSAARGSVDGSQSDSDETGVSGASSLTSSLKPSFTYKVDGLIKQSFSICTSTHQKLHLICYYTKQDILNERLRTPLQDEKLKGLAIPKGIYPDTNISDLPHPHHSTSSPSSPTSPSTGQRVHPHTLSTYENHRSSPYGWPAIPHQRQLSSSSTSSTTSRYTRATSSESFFDSNETTFPPTPPSLTSSPGTTPEEDPLDHSHRRPEHLMSRHSSLAVLPPTPTSPYTLPSSYNSPYNHPPITVPPLATGHSLSDDIFPSIARGISLPPQDIPLEKIRSSEDERQLQALYKVLRL